MKREEVKKEVNEDLKKSYHQLLVDIHEELLHDGRSLEDNVRHALKRITSLFARMGYDSAKAQKRMCCLTYVIIFLGVVQMILYIFRK